jgi:hypothetical protein
MKTTTLTAAGLSFLNNGVESYDFVLSSDFGTIEDVMRSHPILNVVVKAWDASLLDEEEVEELLSNYV